MTDKDEMPNHIDFDLVGKPVRGKYYEAYQEHKRTRGKQKEPTKIAISIRLDSDIVDAYKAKGKGWQTMINQVLRESL